MGICMSANHEEVEKKKKSQAIDRQLEEDSKRLRRECKILLLGKLQNDADFTLIRICRNNGLILSSSRRFRRKRQVDNSQADEDNSPQGIFGRRVIQLPPDRLQEPRRMRKSRYPRHAPIRHRTR